MFRYFFMNIKSRLFILGDAKSEKLDDKNVNLHFGRLYRSICRHLDKEHTVLLLYLMLHRNENFMKHVLSRDDLGNLVRIYYHYHLNQAQSQGEGLGRGPFNLFRPSIHPPPTNHNLLLFASPSKSELRI